MALTRAECSDECEVNMLIISGPDGPLKALAHVKGLLVLLTSIPASKLTPSK